MIIRVRLLLFLSSGWAALSLAACGGDVSRDEQDAGDAQSRDGGSDRDDGGAERGDAGQVDASGDVDAPGDGGAEQGGDGGAVSLDACAAAASAQVTLTELLRFEAEGLAVAVVRYGNPNAGGTPGSIPWLAERFALERADESVCISAPANLTYINSHHNYDDKLEAISGGRSYTFTQQLFDHRAPNEWTISIHEGAGEVLAPTALTLVSCELLKTGGDCLPTYLVEAH